MINITNKIKKRINKVITNKKLLETLGKEGAKIIQVRTSAGHGSSNGKKQKLKPLKPSTIKYRKKNKARLASGVGASKSALTFTGKMIGSITYKVKNKVVSIFLKGRHKDAKMPNEELAAIHEETRPFMSFTDKEEKTLTGIARREIKNILRKLL